MAQLPNAEPTFDLPAGSASDFYLSREAMSGTEKGKIVKKNGLWNYPTLTRRTGDSLVGTNEEITSNEFRHGRTSAKTKLGNASSSGSHDFEFSPETFDDELEGTFRSTWQRWKKDGEKSGIVNDHKTKTGYIYVNGPNGTYNQVGDGTKNRVTQIPLFFVKDGNAGTTDDPYGLIQVGEEKFGTDKKRKESNPFGKFIVHELHVGETPVKYSFLSRIPINGDVVRYQNYKHVEVSEMNLNVTVNAIVTGSFNLMGSNNPSYYTEIAEQGKIRMAEKMGEDEDVAKGTGDNVYSADYKDAAEKFIYTVKNTTKSTETDQLMATETFLTVNGHRIQFASDLTMNINNNLRSIYAIGVTNAIANVSPKLDVTGNLTVYFTDGEEDSNGVKFGADDLKNLASQNEDVELVYTIQDKHEDPDVIYVFQVFKSTFSAPNETKSGEEPITLDMTYNSFGEKAVRILRCAVPKIRRIEIDGEEAVGKSAGNITLVPNVPLDKVEDASVISDVDIVELALIDDEGNEIATTITEGAVTINDDGTLNLAYTTSAALEAGTVIKVKANLNDYEVEASETVAPFIAYMRVGKNYAGLTLSDDTPVSILTAANTDASTAEDYLYYTADGVKPALTDLIITSNGDDIVEIDDDNKLVAKAEGTATITVKYKYDQSVGYKFEVESTYAG